MCWSKQMCWRYEQPKTRPKCILSMSDLNLTWSGGWFQMQFQHFHWCFSIWMVQIQLQIIFCVIFNRNKNDNHISQNGGGGGFKWRCYDPCFLTWWTVNMAKDSTSPWMDAGIKKFSVTSYNFWHLLGTFRKFVTRLHITICDGSKSRSLHSIAVWFLQLYACKLPSQAWRRGSACRKSVMKFRFWLNMLKNGICDGIMNKARDQDKRLSWCSWIPNISL